LGRRSLQGLSDSRGDAVSVAVGSLQCFQPHAVQCARHHGAFRCAGQAGEYQAGRIHVRPCSAHHATCFALSVLKTRTRRIMTEVERILDQLRRSHQGEAWHGPSLRELLEGVTAAQAARKTSEAHSIWEIVFHITAWERVGVARLKGELIEDLPAEEDWP